MTWLIVLVLVVVLALVALELKTSRPDGELRPVHPYRRALSFIGIRRNESVVYFDSYVDATELRSYLDEVNERFEVRLTHAVVAALDLAFYEFPKLNRFVMGRRLYQRYGRWISFSVKKIKRDHTAKLAALKLEMHDEESFKDLCERVNAFIYRERSGERTGQDREMDFLSKVPRPVFAIAVWAIFILDFYNLVPGWFIKSDAMYCSAFFANLGSIGMQAGYHHLYEWGTAAVFVMVGEIEDKPVVVDGEVVVRPMLHLRFSFDERVDDGMTAGMGIQVVLDVLSEPRERLGCLAADGSGDFALISKSPKRD